MKDEWLPESFTDHELSAKIEERCPKALDVRDERLPKSDTDEDACAKNLDLLSQGHSHNEVWSTTLEGVAILDVSMEELLRLWSNDELVLIVS